MSAYIALYRGINVTGNNLVKIEFLRAMHARLGHKKVKSYIQSGNVVFAAKGAAASIGLRIAAEFSREFGFAAKVMVVEAKRWRGMVAANPFAKFAAVNPATVHAGISEGEPNVKGLTDLLAKTGGSEQFFVGRGIVYVHAPDGFGTSRFARGMERAAGVPLTVRNWRTMEALAEMAKELLTSSE